MLLKALQDLFFQLFVLDCVGCGSLAVRPRGLCLACEGQIIGRYISASDQNSKLESGLAFRYLYHWIPDASDTLSNYVYLLKSVVARPQWIELAKLFISRKDLKVRPGTIFIPIPSSKKRRHSLYFAQGLAQQVQGEVLHALLPMAQARLEQKRKNKDERRKVTFQLSEEFTQVLGEAQSIVLVDDVITTGASYKAAYNVLKSNGVCTKNIELWAAFYRESGC